jgi:RNase P subunit RPR2
MASLNHEQKREFCEVCLTGFWMRAGSITPKHGRRVVCKKCHEFLQWQDTVRTCMDHLNEMQEHMQVIITGCDDSPIVLTDCSTGKSNIAQIEWVEDSGYECHNIHTSEDRCDWL